MKCCLLDFVAVTFKVFLDGSRKLFSCDWLIDWFLFSTGCVWYAFIGGVSGLASINTLAAISLDRYLVIARPLQMMHKASKTRSFQHIFLIWCWALAWTLPPWFGWGATSRRGLGSAARSTILPGRKQTLPSSTASLVAVSSFQFA